MTNTYTPEPYESTLEDILAQYEEIYLPPVDEIPLPSDEDAPPEKPLAVPYPPEVYPEKQNAVADVMPKPQHDVPEIPEDVSDKAPAESSTLAMVRNAKPNTMLSYLVSAADVEAAEHEFLLGDIRFPIGEIAIIAGAGGAGKGQLACAHMACASRGYNLAGKKAGLPQKCLFITAEDTAEDVKRRLERSMFRADNTNIFILDKENSYEFGIDLSDPEDPFKLDSLIRATGSALVYLDPLQAFVGEFTDLSRQNHVRRVMHTLAALAERTRCSIVLLMHLNKRQQIANAADLLCGSSDIVNASRSTMLLTNDFKDGNPDRRYLFHIKSNHARSAKTLEINVGEAGNRIVGECEVTADEYVQAVNSRKTSKSAAGAPDYEKMFYAGVEQMIAEGIMQMTYREFVDRFAPNYNGKPKYILDDIATRVEERLGCTIQTRMASKNPIKINNEGGFKLRKIV